MRKRGITLVEVMTSVAILGLLFAVAVPNFLRANLKAREAQLKMQLATVRDAYDRCFADTGTYPSPESLWSATSPGGGWVPTRQGEGWSYVNFPADRWRGPYLNEPLGPPPIPGGTTNGSTTLPHAWSWNSNPPQAAHAFYLNNPAMSTEGTRYDTW